MSRFDLLFYAFALAAVSGALAAALVRDLRHASHWLLATRASLAALSAVLGAPAVAVLQGLAAAGAAAAERRERRRSGGRTLPADVHASPDDAHAAPGDAHAAPGDVHAAPGDVHAAPGDAHAAQQKHAPRDRRKAPWRRWRAALPVLAFFLLSSRAVLMARWPLSPPVGPPPPVVFPVALPLASAGLPHALVTALLLFSIGMFACTMRRSAAGFRIGVSIMSAAAVLPLVAIGLFVGAAVDARLLALLAVGMSALAPWIAAVFPDRFDGSPAAQRLADGMFTVTATVAVALLAAAW